MERSRVRMGWVLVKGCVQALVRCLTLKGTTRPGRARVSLVTFGGSQRPTVGPPARFWRASARGRLLRRTTHQLTQHLAVAATRNCSASSAPLRECLSTAAVRSLPIFLLGPSSLFLLLSCSHPRRPALRGEAISPVSCFSFPVSAFLRSPSLSAALAKAALYLRAPCCRCCTVPPAPARPTPW